MKTNKGFDSVIEKLARTTASKTGRRGFIGRLGGFLVGATMLPLLPVDRRGRLKDAQAATTGSMTREGFQPQDQDPKSCDYWRHCSIDGNLCDCCGGSLTSCPPGTSLSPSSWVASCYNPGDDQTYLIAYRDCCGKQTCGRCSCLNTEGELPVYRPEFSNDIVWCFGADDITYHCTISPVVGKAS